MRFLAVEGVLTIRFRATNAVFSDSTTLTLVVGEEPTPTVLGFDIFNNGVDSSPSRPNAGLAAAGTIRMWTQINGVNTPLPFADLVVTARLPNGNCAMGFVTVHRLWVNQATVNFIDVNRNRPWERIYLTIALDGRTAMVILNNLLNFPTTIST